MSILTKTQLRKFVLQNRQLLENSIFSDLNSRLIGKISQYLEEVSFKTLHVFLPIGINNEPDIQSLLPKLWQFDKNIVVSKTDFKNHSMTHFYLDADTSLVRNKLDIPEPTGARSAYIEDVDLVLVPLLLADKSGNRIGYGAGYYDQLLSQTKAKKVGISLASPVDRISQTDEWDLPMDTLITPFKIYSF